MNDEIKINTKLASYLLEHGIKQNVFAKKIKVCQPVLTHLVHGRKIPSLLTAYRIQKETGGYVRMVDWFKPEDIE